ncbi:ImmA/IrrE family metallo-endopeptidase [Pediococcus inopinatus]|uniref:ImmA/IrrE family metallo-endopeptidase n=1 Tax=Pediococcus inopinatus TaxID=114090 RepID=A0ABZ0Q1S6_9LACO|nr:ImmA/IrrE family metallo-endopeptidase [Pediococcus inopinatus]WPC20891.1 ImmA/IrrE family metallo-endopeptidase [Pediococcus inopinatus]
MNVTLEQLIDRFKKVVTILEVDLYDRFGVYGVYKKDKDGLPFIFIEKNQPEIDKKVILVEEFKHMMTSYGVILNQNNHDSAKQENEARALSYKELITMEDLYDCYHKGLRSEFEIAEELDVPQKFLHNAIEYFKENSGDPIKMKNGGYATINETIKFYKVG